MKLNIFFMYLLAIWMFLFENVFSACVCVCVCVCVCMRVRMRTHSVVSDSLQPPGVPLPNF